jgi:hypothetical protein
MAMDAAEWRLEEEQRKRAWAVWHIAALSRVKKMPGLDALIKQPKAKRLTEEEASEKQADFDRMKERWAAIQQH